MFKFIRRNAVWVGIVLALVLIALGGAPLRDGTKLLDWFKSLLPTLGWFILGTCIVNYLYELHGKQEIVRQVKASVGISDSLDDAGVTNATLDISSIEWKRLISSAKNIDLSVSYATTWRNNYVAQLREFAKNKSSKMRVILPDPNNERLMMSLGARYSRNHADVAQSVREAADFFGSIFKDFGGQKRCAIVFSSNESVYAYHRFDEVCVVTMYHGLGKIGQVPTIQCMQAKGFGELFAKDFDCSFKSAKG